MDAIGTNVGLREDIVGVRRGEEPQLTATGRVGRENRVHTAVRTDGELHAGIELGRVGSRDCEHRRAVEAHCAQMVVGVKNNCCWLPFGTAADAGTEAVPASATELSVRKAMQTLVSLPATRRVIRLVASIAFTHAGLSQALI